MALAAGVVAKNPNEAVPLLLLSAFPEWFAGFCLAAIAVGALVPAAIMSIAASNLFTRNLYGAFVREPMTPEAESKMAKLVSLLVKFGALIFVLKLPATYAIEMQLLGGIWIGQMFPSVVWRAVHAVVPPVGVAGRLGGGHDSGHGDGCGAWTEKLGLSAALGRPGVRDVCGGASAAA